LVLGLLNAAPAKAVEIVLIRLPLLRDSFTLKLSELSDPASLLRGKSDVAELNRASGGSFGRQLVDLFQQPLPIQTSQVLDKAAGTALKEQILLALSSVVGVDDLPVDSPGGMAWVDALQQAAARQGTLTLAGVLRELPGRSVTIDLEEAVWHIGGISRQQRQADQRLAGQMPQAVDPAHRNIGALGHAVCLALQQATALLQLARRLCVANLEPHTILFELLDRDVHHLGVGLDAHQQLTLRFALRQRLGFAPRIAVVNNQDVLYAAIQVVP
jgi:hypothetical protein